MTPDDLLDESRQREQAMVNWNKKAWAELTVAERNAAFLRECECERRAGATREEMLFYMHPEASPSLNGERYLGWLRRILTGAE